MRKTAAQPPILNIRIHFPSSSQSPTQPDAQPTAVDHSQVLRQLSDAEIVRRLKVVRHSSQHERNARRAASIHGIAQAAGLSREFIHRIANGGERLSPRSRQALSQVLSDL